MKSRYLVIISIIIVLGIIIGTQRKPPKDEINLSSYDVATFAGGCFWCMEAAFESAEGVVESVSGYTGGDLSNPIYEQVTRGDTGHFEAVQVYYEPDKIAYNELLEVFWRNIDPTDDSGQFVDKGTQYKTAIFFHDINQKNQA
jgi:peptide methionine sulfoxide reductase msrA/msrB